MPFLLAAALIGITALSLYPSLNNGFTNWDDPIHVLENGIVKDLSSANLKRLFSSYVGGNYYPLTILSYAVEYHFAGLNPKVYHATNLVLHLVNVLLVYWLIFLLTGRRAVSWMTALVFGIHPVHVEPVAWISSRKDVLFSVFYLGALISYVFHLKKPRFQNRFFWFSFALFTISFLAKPVAASFPFLLLAVDYYVGRKWDRRVFLEKIPFLAVTLILGIVAYFAQVVLSPFRGVTSYSGLERFLFVAYGLVIFPFKFIAPFHLSGFYPYPDKTGNALPLIYNISPFLVIVMAYAVYRTVRRTRDVLFGALFFLITVFVVLRFYPVAGFIIADRYTYLPYIGLSFIAAGGVGYLAGSRALWARRVKPAVFVIVLGCLAGLSALAWQRCGVWKDGVTLWNDVIRQYPRLVIAYHYRGRAYYDKGQYDLAIADFNRALELKPDYAKGYNSRGKAYSKKKLSALAVADFNKAIEHDPGYGEAYVNRGAQYVLTGEYGPAREDLDRAAKLAPDIPEIYANRGKIYAETGAYAQAVEEFARALALNPSFHQVYSSRGEAYLKLKQYDAAIADYTRALSLGGDDPDAYYYRGTAYGLKGQYDAAVADFDRVIAIDPDHLEAYYNRGSSYKNKGDYDAAIADYTKALGINPDYARAYLKRAEAYKLKKEFARALEDALKAASMGMKVDGDFLADIRSAAGGASPESGTGAP